MNTFGNLLQNVVSTLPCPFCREHAINYTKNIKLSEVSSKSKLQNILFDFHNVTNRNNGKTIENKDVLKNIIMQT